MHGGPHNSLILVIFSRSLVLTALLSFTSISHRSQKVPVFSNYFSLLSRSFTPFLSCSCITLCQTMDSLGDTGAVMLLVDNVDILQWWDRIRTTNEPLEDCIQKVMQGLDGARQSEQVQTILGHVLMRQEQYSELLVAAYEWYEKNELYSFYDIGQQKKETLWHEMGDDFYSKVVKARGETGSRASAIKALEQRWRRDFKDAIPNAYHPGRIGVLFAKMFSRFPKQCTTFEEAWGTEGKPGILPPIIDARIQSAVSKVRWAGVTIKDLEVGLKQLSAAKVADAADASKSREKRPQAANFSYKESAVSKKRRTGNRMSQSKSSQEKALIQENQVTTNAEDFVEDSNGDVDENGTTAFDGDIDEEVSEDIGENPNITADNSIPGSLGRDEGGALGSLELCETKWQREREETVRQAQDASANRLIDLVDNESVDKDSEEEQQTSSQDIAEDEAHAGMNEEEVTEPSIQVQPQTGRSTRQATRKPIEEATVDEPAKGIYNRKALPENPAAEDDGPYEKAYVSQPNIRNYFHISFWSLMEQYTGRSHKDLDTKYTDYSHSFVDDFLAERDLISCLNVEIVGFTAALRSKYSIATADKPSGPHRIRVQNMCYTLIQQMLRQDPVLYAMVVATQKTPDEVWKLISCPWHALIVKNNSKRKPSLPIGLRILQRKDNFIRVEYHLELDDFDEHWIFPFDFIVLGGWTEASDVAKEIVDKLANLHSRCEIPSINIMTQDKVDYEIWGVPFEPCIRFPACSALGEALIGLRDWQSPLVNRDLCALFSSDMAKHHEFVQSTREKMYKAYFGCLHEFIESYKQTWNEDLALLCSM